MSRQPPRWAAKLLARLLRADERDAILGDLEERWRKRGESGWWYSTRAVSLAFWILGDVLRHLPATLRTGLRGAWRGHARAPASSALMVATIAIGIGGTAAIFSVIDGVLLEPLAYPEPERLMTIAHRGRVGDGPDILPASTATHVVYEQGSRAFEALAVYAQGEVSLIGPDAPPVQVSAVWPTRSLFHVLGVPPVLGRIFSPEEDAPGGPPVVLISHDLWRSRFGGDVSVVGGTLHVDGRARQIVGVMPAGFDFPTRSIAVWLPLQLDRNDLGGFNTPA